MVLDAEGQLQAASQQNEFVTVTNLPEVPVMKHEDVVVKIEPEEVAVEQNFMETEYRDCGSDGSDVEAECRLASDEARLLARFPPANVRTLPTRNTLYELCPKYVIHLDMLQGKKVLAKDIQSLLNKGDSDEPLRTLANRKADYITDKNGHINNAAVILENSNVTAFKGKSRSGLPCFYCKEIFDNITSLRNHQKTHSKADIKTALKSHKTESLVVNVDIADLKCTVCDTNQKNLKDLKVHLIAAHAKKIYADFEERIVPFVVPEGNNFICQMCGFKYESFGSLERHMNMHFRNYICDSCGTGFVTYSRLRMHAKTMHVDGSFKCELCQKIYPSHQKLKSHVDTVHKCLKRFKCTKCPERFTDYFKRHQHLVETHGVPELEYKCNVCDKVYARRYMLSRHMKRDHLEERYFQCDICFHKCFARRDLESHMVKHNGARIFECSVCKKAYARKKTLTEHMRIHNNDRRFACAVCGLAFVQNCSLKGHMKTHHPEAMH
ncbi:uncharacterized protein isoform X2 [Choristoneura fumiferana]